MARLPLATREELLEELAENTRELERAYAAPAVNLERRLERLAILQRWDADLRAQLDELGAALAAGGETP